MKSIAIIGGGNMGEALIKGLRGKRLCVCESDLDRARRLKNTYKVRVAGLDETVAGAGVVIFAVKPQDMLSVVKQIKANKQTLYISIAAGLTTKFFEKNLGGNPRVVRAMPNLPGLIGEGITALCKGRYASNTDLDEAKKILGCLGETLGVEEKMMDAVTAVSGSGPAYVFLFLEQWIEAAKSLGFTEAQSSKLVSFTISGSVGLLKDMPPKVLRAKVSSKGGTTEAAMKVFFNSKFDQIMKKALLAASTRAKELSK